MYERNLIDFHCHLDLYDDFENLINSCERQRIYTLTVTTTPRAWVRNKALTENTHYVKAALGLHPQLVNGNMDEELALWESYLSETRYIGEVGVDAGARYIRTLEEQVRIFKHILYRCSEAGDKILSVHSIHAASIVLDNIQKLFPKKRGSVVMHWFTGTLEEAKWAVDIGCYFSVNTEMLKSQKGSKLIQSLPLERIITETDGPFTRHQNRATVPEDVFHTINTLAILLKIPSESMSKQIFQNTKKLLEEKS